MLREVSSSELPIQVGSGSVIRTSRFLRSSKRANSLRGESRDPMSGLGDEPNSFIPGSAIDSALRVPHVLAVCCASKIGPSVVQPVTVSMVCLHSTRCPKNQPMHVHGGAPTIHPDTGLGIPNSTFETNGTPSPRFDKGQVHRVNQSELPLGQGDRHDISVIVGVRHFWSSLQDWGCATARRVIALPGFSLPELYQVES